MDRIELLQILVFHTHVKDEAGKCWALACACLTFARAHSTDPTPHAMGCLWPNYAVPTCGASVALLSTHKFYGL